MKQKNSLGRYIEISKRSQTFGMHYYEVTPHDHPEIKPFYIGLNEATKKLFFYKKIEKGSIATIDLEGPLHYYGETAQDRVPRWLIFLCLKKARDAFLTGKFPSNISLQS